MALLSMGHTVKNFNEGVSNVIQLPPDAKEPQTNDKQEELFHDFSFSLRCSSAL
jgi:hypothetical protein